MSQPLSNKANRKAPVWVLLVFTLFGLVFLFPFFVLPACKMISARNWTATPCVVVSSSVQSHYGRKGNTYSVNMVYNYAVEGRQFTGRRYQFLGGSSGGRTGKAAIVAQYPPGTKAVCYVNPADPADAVFERGFTPDMWYGLIPLAFVAIGIWSMIFTSRSAKQRASAQWQPAAMQHAADFNAVPRGARELRPAHTPLGKLTAMLFFALFWNGFISIFIFVIVGDARFSRGNSTGGGFHNGMLLFMTPFVLVGIGLILAVLWDVLALFNPRVHLRLNPGAVALGDALTLEWNIAGRANALSSLRITLEGSEAATFQNGKNTSTATNTFSTVELVNTTDPAGFASGSVQAALPRDTMHSLDTGYNKILWQLRVRGKIPRWPDLSEDYPLVVLPLRKGDA